MGKKRAGWEGYKAFRNVTISRATGPLPPSIISSIPVSVFWLLSLFSFFAEITHTDPVHFLWWSWTETASHRQYNPIGKNHAEAFAKMKLNLTTHQSGVPRGWCPWRGSSHDWQNVRNVLLWGWREVERRKKVKKKGRKRGGVKVTVRMGFEW